MLLGVGLTMTTTMLLLHPMAAGEVLFWWVAGFAFVASVALVTSGIYAINTPAERGVPRYGAAAQRAAAGAPLGRVTSPQPQEAPKLGELLVEHYRLISAADLERALERQKATKRKLGETLVEMGLLSEEDLLKALNFQAELADPWRLAL
jgi:hypothetical protein